MWTMKNRQIKLFETIFGNKNDKIIENKLKAKFIFHSKIYFLENRIRPTKKKSVIPRLKNIVFYVKFCRIFVMVIQIKKWWGIFFFFLPKPFLHLKYNFQRLMLISNSYIIDNKYKFQSIQYAKSKINWIIKR